MKALLALMPISLMPLTSYAANSSTAELLSTVPPEQRIVIPAVGETLARLVVFVDTDCPYCMQLHDLRDAITERGVEIQYIFYPRLGPSAESYAQAIAVWCSADRLAALERVLKGGVLPAADCTHPVMTHYALALKLDLKGTPAIVTPDGIIAYGVPGSM